MKTGPRYSQGRTAFIYSPSRREMIFSSAGPTEKVRLSLSDYQANEPLHSQDWVVVRLPRRLQVDCWLNRIVAPNDPDPLWDWQS